MTQGIGSLTGASPLAQTPPRAAPRVAEGSKGEQPAEQGGSSTQSSPAALPSRVDVKSVAAELDKALKQLNGRFSASVDDATGMVVVRITDCDTGELVKQVPPQQVLDANVSMEKIIGLLVNDQA